MPSRLHRYQQTGDLHFITFSCYRRRPKLGEPIARAACEQALERTRRQYGLGIVGYVVMPEHVHLLVNEPGRGTLAAALQALKQSVARTLALRGPEPFWQARYYDFNVWTARKQTEKLKYLHRNPVTRGLASRPEDWRGRATGITSRGLKERSRSSLNGRRSAGSRRKSYPAQAELERGTPFTARPDHLG